MDVNKSIELLIPVLSKFLRGDMIPGHYFIKNGSVCGPFTSGRGRFAVNTEDADYKNSIAIHVKKSEFGAPFLQIRGCRE